MESTKKAEVSDGNTRRRRCGLSAYLSALVGAALLSDSATILAEQLELRLQADGYAYQVVKHLDGQFEYFESGALEKASSEATKTYDAIRCDGAWGAMKYQVELPSGPGFTLLNDGLTLQLRIVEHRVLSADRNIQAMKIQCQELAPRALVHAVAEIELQRGQAHADQITLANGYQLEFDYRP
ncbi:hypothetical protein [Microbulbifer aggregans]|uniref:hypothetical protein n=1 Tax=Microbulbifer aggregans TaxID=1769779 RepID=UPI001CFCE924|nr:hypothetical protein [Microbulbifer aggregans]